MSEETKRHPVWLVRVAPLTGLVTPRIGTRPVIVTDLACMPPEDQAPASGTDSTAREIGVALAIATLVGFTIPKPRTTQADGPSVDAHEHTMPDTDEGRAP